jgi:hypothetical protein
MTILGQEGIARAELEKRLRTTDLTGQVKDLTRDKVISALVVSFYFRGGNTALGCEFTHKAFREYLFAEAIVETLKACARALPDDLPQRPSSLYWKDFDKSDPRQRPSLDLAALLGPQWLSPEVVSHLGSLLEWEIARASSSSATAGASGATLAATPEEWRRARTLLADLWDWWADGVHLRPQPKDDEDTGQIKWDSSLAERLVPKCRPLIPSPTGGLPEPLRTTTLDAHLGDALFRLSAWVHRHLQGRFSDDGVSPPRRSQHLDGGRLTFRPTGTDGRYFGVLCCRISAAGWRPDGQFPGGVDAKGINLKQTELNNLAFDGADLGDVSFEASQLDQCSMNKANLAGCTFSNSALFRCDFALACLDRADFGGAFLISNRFNGATFIDAPLGQLRLGDSYSYGSGEQQGNLVRVPENDFSNAVGIAPAVIEQARARGARPLGPSSPQSARKEPPDID